MRAKGFTLNKAFVEEMIGPGEATAKRATGEAKLADDEEDDDEGDETVGKIVGTADDEGSETGYS